MVVPLRPQGRQTQVLGVEAGAPSDVSNAKKRCPLATFEQGKQTLALHSHNSVA